MEENDVACLQERLQEAHDEQDALDVERATMAKQRNCLN
jgi:hypothetical protein